MSLPWQNDEARERELAAARAWGTHGNTTCPTCAGTGTIMPKICGLVDDFRPQTCSTCRGKRKI